MKTLVAVKQVADPNTRVRFSAEGQAVDLAGIKMAINPFDEVAVEAAVRAREEGSAGDVVAVTVGPEKSKEVLRHALAMGADRGVHLTTDVLPDPLSVAKLLRVVAIEEQADLVLLGKQSSDSDNNQTGQMLAALLGWPQATAAVGMVRVDRGIEVSREIDGGIEVMRLRLPAVVTVDLRLNEPRFASLPNIMKAKAKPVAVRDAADLAVDLTPRVVPVRVEPPPPRQPGVRVASVTELVSALRERSALP
jgi:electron transfer flavoprotein beta subunit